MYQDDPFNSLSGISERSANTETSEPVRPHSVQFYEDDALFLDTLSEYAGAALGAGGACIIIATSAHRLGLADRLRTAGIDLSFARAMNRYISLDSAEILDRFMVSGVPDEKLFFTAIKPHLLCARKALRSGSASTVVFSELVALLWQHNQYQAAIDTEKLWDQLSHEFTFSLRCAYPSGLFSEPAQYELFRQVCSTHNRFVSGQQSVFGDAQQNDRNTSASLTQRASTIDSVTAAGAQVTARNKSTEEQIQLNQELCNALVESKSDCIHVLDLDGRIVYLNQLALAVADRHEPNALLGQAWVEHWQNEDRVRIEEALNLARSDCEGNFQIEQIQNGTLQNWDVKLTPLHDSDGKVERILVVSRDTTDLFIAQRAAFEAEKQATAGQLAATIVHEINNPLEAVTNYLYLAQTSADIPHSVTEYLHIADSELSRIAQISRQILGFYRGGSKRQWTPVARLIEGVLLVLDRRLRNKQIEPAISIEADLEVCATEGQLRQALLNLTANAIDASRVGGKLWIRARRSTNWISSKSGQSKLEGVRISIADNGAGIAPDVKKKIFVPFFTTKAQSGSGIGLWVTKCLIEQQGGTLNFCSSQGERAGTVMSLWLPSVHAENDQRTEVAA